VEDPVRAGPLLTRRRPALTFACSAAGMVAVLALANAGVSDLRQQIRTDERAAAQTIAAHPKCFGAAARDPRHPCANAKLAHTVVPTPAQARKIQRPCDAVERTKVMVVCAFGRPPAQPKGTAVLVGDSHAMHLQQTVEVVTNKHGWSGLLNARSHCAYTFAIQQLDEPDRSGCIERNRDMPGWFRRHPEVSVAFMAHLGHTTIRVQAKPGQSEFEAEVDGYQRAWRALPRTVKHIVVVRDTPYVPVGTMDCVERAMDRHQRVGTRCAVPRAVAPDAAAVAARRLHDPRVRVVDLNRFICDRRYCYPVIGGVLVFKDLDHLTPTFATTLGPFLDRRVARLFR
jgi:hypothetical protein